MINLATSDTGMDNDEPIYVAETRKRVQSSPLVPAKRLKQARLPFMKISSPVGSSSSSPVNHNKKRHLSNSEDENVKSVLDNRPLEADKSNKYNLKKTLVVVLIDCKENKSPPQHKRANIQKKSKADKHQLPMCLEGDAADGKKAPVCGVDNINQSWTAEGAVIKNSNTISSSTTVNSETSDVDKAESLNQNIFVKTKGNTACSNSEVEVTTEGEQISNVENQLTTTASNELDENANGSVQDAQSYSAKTADQSICPKKKRSKRKSDPFDMLDKERAKLEKLKSEIDECTQKNSETTEITEQNEHSEGSADTTVTSQEEKKELQSDAIIVCGGTISSNSDAVGCSSTPLEQPVELATVNITSTQKKKKFTKVRRSTDKEDLKKELQKQERLKVQLEIEKLKAELRKQKEDAKQQRKEEKAFAAAKKLQEKQAKKEYEEKEKEEKRKRDEALQEKLEEKQRKLKEKQEKEEEKKKAKEEQQRKKNKVKAVFASFFVKKDVAQIIDEVNPPGHFLPFQAKENVRLAPRCRNNKAGSAEFTKKLDSVLKHQTCAELYLEELKSRKITPGKSPKTWPIEDKDISIVEFNSGNETKKQPRTKLLQFSENVRPPYYGTWRKKSKIISPRRPLQRDVSFFDYEVDSEEEWEEEEPGESLSHTEDEKESEDEYEVDNEFFVPHGYLSAEENQDEDGVAMSPDDFKAQLRIKEKEFENEMKQKCQKIQPAILGCIWISDSQPGSEELVNILVEFSAIVLTSCPIETRYSLESAENESKQSSTNTSLTASPCDTPKTTPSMTKPVLKFLPDEVMPAFIKLVHGLQFGQKVIYSEFGEFYRLFRKQQFYNSAKENGDVNVTTEDTDKSFSNGASSLVVPLENAASGAAKVEQLMAKSVMKRTLRQIASWNKFPEKGGFAWIVKEEVREKYNLMELPISNQWKFLTEVEPMVPHLTSGSATKSKKSEKPTNYLKSKVKKIPFKKFLERVCEAQQKPDDVSLNNVSTDLTLEKALPSLDDYQSHPLIVLSDDGL